MLWRIGRRHAFHAARQGAEGPGTLDVLRHGVKIIPNIDIQLCALRPASAKDPALLARYEANTQFPIGCVAKR